MRRIIQEYIADSSGFVSGGLHNACRNRRSLKMRTARRRR